MGSPLGPILANIFLSPHEENWLNKCPIEFKQSFYGRYIDDIFVLFESRKAAHSHRKYHKNINFTVEQENICSFSFLDVKTCCKTVNLSVVFRENQHLFINRFSFQRTKKGNIYTHHFMGVLVYVVNSGHLVLKLIIWRLFSWKTIIPQISLIRELNHFLISCIQLKLLFIMYLKEIFLVGWHSWEVLCFKFERILRNYLVINWRLLIWKSFLRHLLEAKAFSLSKISYLRCYFRDLLISISVVAEMPTIMVWPNAILKSKFVNI